MNSQVGVFTGGFSPANAQAFQNWIGKQVAFCTDYVALNADGTENAGWDMGEWYPMKAVDPNFNLHLGIPLYAAHLASYPAMAALIAKSYPKAIIRPGWEMNGDWEDWSISKIGAASYVSTFQAIVKAFRAASPEFIICWCPAIGQSNPTAAYPGDAYVDVIGLDAYLDYRWSPKGLNPIETFAWFKGQQTGLTWAEGFAHAHGKQMSLPEWGVNRDDPYFIEHMAAHFKGQGGNPAPYAFASYWDSDSNFQGRLSPALFPGDTVPTSQYPNAAAAYLANW